MTTSGIGVVPEGRVLTARACRAGDAILVSGTLGDHGVAVLAAREHLDFGGQLSSDTVALTPLVDVLIAAAPGARCLRDPTRGGLAATLVELGSASGLAAVVDEDKLPIAEATRGALELLGLDALLVANEGKLCAVVPAGESAAALAAWRAHPLGKNASIVGRFVAGEPGSLEVRTTIGGRRRVVLPLTDPLPRICRERRRGR